MSTKVASAFLERIQKSGLIPGERLSQLRQELETEGVDVSDPAALAAALVEREEITQWQADKLLQGKHKGFFLGSYRLERPLGKGGMGAVFLARHVVMRRRCAIKVLPQTQIQKHSSVLDRFILESQAVASLDHQNIVRAYDVAKEVKDDKEIHYLVMEYVEGQDAQQMVQEHGVMDCVKAAELIRQTANGLAHAHESGLIHRDIKPANLLIDKKGVIKILDLGLARFFDDSESASLTAAHNETVLGTADYLSPEQALNSHDVDLRTDIYSLGCTAYFMLTGHPPFPDGTVAQRLVAHQVKQPTPITDERRDAPPELVAIIDKMMAKKPENRFQTATEISTALAAWLIKFGGEDWRRQHSEITADSAILKLLTREHEPTRAMSSPMSETELELAPLDDEEEEEASPAPRPASKPGSGIAAGSSGPSEGDLQIADDEEDDQTETESAVEQLPSLDEEVEPVVGLDELPQLDVSSEQSPLDDGLFGDLPEAAELEQATVDSSPGLGALESDIRKMPLRSPSSSTRQKQTAQEKPKTFWESLTSVGLPIILGVGGGGLVLLIVLLVVWLFSGSDSSIQRQRLTSDPARPIEEVSPAVPDETPQPDQPPTPDEVAAQKSTADEPAAKERKPKPSGQPDDRDTQLAQADSDRPAEPGNRRPQGSGQPERPREEPAAQPQPTTTLQDQDPAAADTAVTQQQPEAKSDGPRTAAQGDVGRAGGTKLPPEPVQPQPKPQISPEQIFARLTAFALDVSMEVGSGGGPNNKPQQNVQSQIAALRPGIQAAVEYALRNSGLELVTDSETAVMHVTIYPGETQNFKTFDIAASLDCRDQGSEPLSVWKLERTEVMRFTSAANPRVLRDTWEDNLRDTFRTFRADHEEALTIANQ